MTSAKSLTLTFPTFLQSNLISHFVRGFFDGDGCVYYYERLQKCQTQTCGTRDFCETLSKILYSLGIKNSIKYPKQCHDNTVVLSTNGNKSTYQFLSWLYKDADLKMDRKYQKYLYFCGRYNKQAA
jgi:intein-encoded DNA endonuclease-like protein